MIYNWGMIGIVFLYITQSQARCHRCTTQPGAGAYRRHELEDLHHVFDFREAGHLREGGGAEAGGSVQLEGVVKLVVQHEHEADGLAIVAGDDFAVQRA